MKRFYNSIILILLPFSFLYAQFNEFEPEYTWLTLEGKNVKVHFHPEAERTARVVLKIADEVWEPITSLYEYEPETVHYVIKDIDDYSNGATFFFDNKIEIWASSLDFDLRGAHNWLRNVISHEFTHLVQIQAAMKMGRGIPAFYLQLLSYEDVRRPDILYGYPNVIVSYPVATINMPAWFAEGTAQYMREEFNYDNWDSHRDMILRSYALDNNMLTWNEMGVFGKTSLGNESVYNSGFALTKYISQKYGEDKLRKITYKLGKLTNFTIDAAFEDVLGKDGNEIYDEWSSYLKEDYNNRVADIRTNLVEGEILSGVGFGNFYPNYSDDGKKLLFISNKTADYFGASSLFLYDLETKEEKHLISNVRSTAEFIPGTNKIIYAQLSEDNPNWTNIHDLYIYDIDEDDSDRITFGLRANNPSVSNDGKKIVFAYQKDGTTNLATVDINGKNYKRITLFENGEQVFNPRFSNDDSYIIFDYSYHQGRDIAKIDSNGANLEFILNSEHDERNGIFDKDGKLIYSSDKTGIFNLYLYNLKAKTEIQLTNVLGGAFMPTIDERGDIVYSGYNSSGYKIFKLDYENREKVDPSKKYIRLNNPPLDTSNPNGDIENFKINALRNFDDYKYPDQDAKDYSGFFSKLTFFPFIRYDNYNPQTSGIDKLKPGLYLTSSDVLNRYSFFAGGAINTSLERDLFLIFEYRNRLPLLYNLGLKPDLSIELYSISRETELEIPFGVDSTYNPPRYDYLIPTDVTYDLFEFDIAAKHKIFAAGNDVEFRFVFSQYTAKLGSFKIPGINELYPTTKDTYFIGRAFKLTYTHNGLRPHAYADINPIGRHLELFYTYELNEFNDENEYVVEDGLLKPLYNDYKFHSLELKYREHIETFKYHTLTFQARAATIFGPTVPDFFDFYLGGLVGMKSYPFYAISGNELAWLNFTYRFPIFRSLDTRIGHLYLDKVYLSVFADLGNAWTGNSIPNLEEFKKGAGAELRIKMNSFYLFPTSIFFSAAYAFDEHERTVRGELIKYGKEWRFYGGILFDFNF